MIVVRAQGGKTAKELARVLGCRTVRCKSDCFGCRANDNRNGTIVNYGGKCVQADINRNVVADKLKAYKIMQEAGIPQPEMWKDYYDIPKSAYPVFGRKKYHSRGLDIVTCEDDYDAENSGSDFFMKYIDKKAEYRVHVFKGEPIFISRKHAETEDADPTIRNRAKGWQQVTYSGKWVEKLGELGVEAVKALNYDFGCADIIRDQDNNLIVLEVNSNPSLEPRKLIKYAELLIGVL